MTPEKKVVWPWGRSERFPLYSIGDQRPDTVAEEHSNTFSAYWSREPLSKSTAAVGVIEQYGDKEETGVFDGRRDVCFATFPDSFHGAAVWRH